MAPATLSPEEGAAAKNVGEGHGSDAGTPARRLRSLHPDVAELLQRTRDRRTRKARVAKGGEVGRARYDYVFEEELEGEEGLPAPPRLVWAKVRGYHWWPAQGFDPADASALALGERRRRGAALVANFWERTFAWEADPAALRPAFTRWRGTKGLPAYTVWYGIRDIADGAMGATPARRGRASGPAKRGRARGDSADGKWKDSRCVTCGRARESVEDALEVDNYEPTTKMGKLMRRAARRMSLSPPVNRRADRATPTPTPTPPANAGVRMARPEGFSVAVVICESSLDAAAAFAGTAKIAALSPNLISFRLAYSLSAPAQADSPQSPMNADEMDHLLDEAEGMDLLDLLAVEALH
uniref:Uncharacterized protein n=1 Tax=Aegilops tauschii TaxID=37682 RepID=N1QZV7_AEGTA